MLVGSCCRLRGRLGWCVDLGLGVGPVRGHLGARGGGAMG